MSTADDLRRLADLVERIERDDVAVREVSPLVATDDGLVAEVTVTLPPDGQRATAETTTRADADAPAADDDPATAPSGESADEGPDAPEEGGDQGGQTDADGQADGDTQTDVDAPPSPAVDCRHPDCEETFDTEHGMRVHAAKVHADDGGEGPAYTDPAALREAYEHGGTFAEMTEYLGVDVTPATVRRHMVSHGIHEPDSQQGPDLSDVDDALGEQAGSLADEDESDAGVDGPDGGATDADDGEAGDVATDAADGAARSDGDPGGVERGGAAADGPGAGPSASQPPAGPGTDLERTLDAVSEAVDESVDLPEGVTLERVVEAVAAAKTLHDVTEALGLERDRTRALLSALDLTDLVTGRLSERSGSEDAAARIDARLRRLADEGAEEAH